VQLAVAAVMRHSFAGLAIPTFPLSTPDGALLPTAWDFRVAIQFAHRVMAALLAVALPWFAIALWRERVRGSGQKNGALLLVALLALQIFLGAEAVWRLRDPYWTTAHVLAGACLLATTFGLTWWTHRGVIESRAGAARRVGEPFASPRAGLAPDLGQKQTPTSNGALGTRPSREASTFAKATADRPEGTATRPTFFSQARPPHATPAPASPTHAMRSGAGRSAPKSPRTLASTQTPAAQKIAARSHAPIQSSPWARRPATKPP
jgi:hypothetical protein